MLYGMRSLLRFLALMIAILLPSVRAAAQQLYDLVVYGGTGAGVVAAARAGGMGKSVVLIEPSRHLGGVTSGGLTATDMGNRQTIAGLTRDFYRRVLKFYQEPANWRYGSFAEYAASPQGKNHLAADAMFAFEPNVAERVFNEMATEAKVTVVLGERLDLKDGVKKDGARIVSIRMESGKTF